MSPPRSGEVQRNIGLDRLHTKLRLCDIAYIEAAGINPSR